MIKYFSLLLFLSFISCDKETKTITELENIHASIKTEFAPDKRVELFEIYFENTRQSTYFRRRNDF